MTTTIQTSPEDVHEDVTGYRWKVTANNRDFRNKKKGFFCWQKEKCTNRIKTSKYNVLTFIPLNLWEQYQRGEVIYFTIIVILQCIPQVSTMPIYVILSPLICILVTRCFRDLIIDIVHSQNDKLVNNKPCEILRGERLVMEKWKDVQIGDIVCVRKDDFVPADMLLLNSTEPDSLCYVETAGIDGETNLKLKQSLAVTNSTLKAEKALSEFNGLVTCEEPNNRLHTFIGNLEWKGKTYPINNENILLRDCRVRNTEQCYGLVIYAGSDTKIMKNSGKVILKKTKLEFLINKNVLCIAAMLICTSICMGILAGVWDGQYLKKHHYIPGHPRISSTLMGLIMTGAYFVAMSTLVPFFLYIGLEFIHLLYNSFINNDISMYFADTDVPALARAPRLNDLLGQIEYVFTDKTGTLTQNVMTFKKCCIGHRMFGTSEGEGKHQVSFEWNKYADMEFTFYDQSLIDLIIQDDDPLVSEFFRMIALCHTVMVDERDGRISYKASSPDEEALVKAARNFGYVFLSRNHETITISELGVVKTYHILVLMDFNSDRKRMSILVRNQEGSIKLYTKGADVVVLQRLNHSCLSDIIEEALNHFSEETLRTLCLAYKEVEESIYEQWNLKYEKASRTLHNREQIMSDLYEEMEQNLLLLGATAIEDKLQEGVSETIRLMREGNIKVWMLTGDKQETAVNIGYSCDLLTKDMQIVEYSEIRDYLDNIMGSNKNDKELTKHEEQTRENFNKKALVLTGENLSNLLEPKDEETRISIWKRLILALRRKVGKSHSTPEGQAFIELAKKCQSVICCRVTPTQKAGVVQLVKDNLNVTTLCIGDGGNDVNMIKSAHIGVGIYGKEGMQAVLASDYSVAQFSFLQQLLYIHGRLSYIRLSKFLCYYNYKTVASLMNNFWYGFFNGFSVLLTTDMWFLLFNALLYSFLPALYIGVIDKDVDKTTTLQHPELYKSTQKDRFRGWRVFLYCIYGIYTSLVMLFIPYGAFFDSAGPNGIFDCQVFAYASTTTGIIAVWAEAAVQYNSWSVLAFISIGLPIGIYFLVTYLTGIPAAFFYSKADFPTTGAFVNIITSGYMWLLMLLGATISIIPSLFFRPWTKFSNPNLSTVSEPENNVVLQNVIRRSSMRRRSSYAFSQCEGHENIISRTSSQRKLAKINGAYKESEDTARNVCQHEDRIISYEN
uniref:Phospholipid-transporting ATPase n=1 Tax=Leptobrachium leishanense TaxID=445787 RepID=A0A8C5P6W0_9ANUR